MISGKQVGIESHVSRAARVGVIGEADELCSFWRAVGDQRVDGFAAQLWAENDEQIAFGGERVAQLSERFGGDSQLCGRSIVAGEEGDKIGLGAGGDFRQPVQPDA